MRIFLTVIWALSTMHVCAQLTQERAVIGCFGLTAQNVSMSISSTSGEAVSQTINSNTLSITQGFQQPQAQNSLAVQYTIYKNECNQTYEVIITSITGCPTGTTYQIYWNNQLSPYYTENLPSQSALYITSTAGCSYFAFFDFSILQYQLSPCELVFYNYISPNGDGDNDEWKIRNIDNAYFRRNHVSIYNRWGVVVWEAPNYDNVNTRWYGQSSTGELLPDGTYFYKLEVAGQSKTGYVELIR